MSTNKRSALIVGLSLSLALASGGIAWTVWAQPHGGAADCPCHQGQHGHGRGAGHRDDMMIIHALFADPTIRRTVREIPGGVETITESSTPDGAATLQKHVAAMHDRVTKSDPFHARDPLFAELFAHASEITMVVENTAKGVKVRETSTTPYVTDLIRAHAAVVTKFIENGRREMHVDHPVPAH